MIRRTLVALIILLAIPAFGESFTKLETRTAAQVLATQCSSANVGTRFRVTDSLSTIVVAPGGTNSIDVRCDPSGEWVPIIGARESITMPANNYWVPYGKNPLFDNNTAPASFSYPRAFAATGAAVSGNTGTGTMGSITVSSGVKVGVYQLTVTGAAADSEAFTITDPTGILCGRGKIATAFSGACGLAFTISDTSTDFVPGDAFTITVARVGAMMIWNDIDVHTNSATFLCPGWTSQPTFYCAWVSLGLNGSGDDVSTEYLVSTDAITWTWIATVMTKTSPSDIGEYGIETPSVIDTLVVGSQRYRMAYTVYDDPPGTVFYTTHFAYSSNGLSWTKLGESDICANAVQQSGNPWGYFACAEPSLRYVAGDSRPIKWYFVQARCNVTACTGFPPAARRIEMADSELDWSGGIASAFTDRATVLTQQKIHDRTAGWDGYSTPNVYCEDTGCLLAASIFRKDGLGVHQPAIALFHSTDGATGQAFETDNPLVTSTWTGQPWWNAYEVRAPSIFRLDSSTLCMLYAGNGTNTSGQGPPFQIGIGRTCEYNTGL